MWTRSGITPPSRCGGPGTPNGSASTWSQSRTTCTSRSSMTPGPCSRTSRRRRRRITVVPTVATLPLRPPAVLAKAAASLDLLSGGRVQLGLGGGAFWDAITAMGGPRRTAREAVDALSEAIDIIRAMWSGQRSVRVSGHYYTLSGTHPGPQPSPGLGIWLGAYGPRMLALTGAKADGWLPSHAYLGLDRLRAASSRVDEAARAADRDPAQLRKLYNIAGFVGA